MDCGRGGRDNSHDLSSSFDVLGAVPTFPNTTTLDAEPSSQQHNAAYRVDGEGLASGTLNNMHNVQEQPLWPCPVVREFERKPLLVLSIA